MVLHVLACFSALWEASSVSEPRDLQFAVLTMHYWSWLHLFPNQEYTPQVCLMPEEKYSCLCNDPSKGKLWKLWLLLTALAEEECTVLGERRGQARACQVESLPLPGQRAWLSLLG